jgi:hypothetical protein
MAWDTRFDTMLKEFPNLRVKHFDMGREAISFINGLSADKKTKVFLLTDYELLKQNLNGLDIIEETNTKRAVLVTSHYANKEICQAAVQCGAKILPKQLASDIPIDITPNSNTNNEQSKADIVFVDDDTMLLKCVTLLAKNTAIDTYDNPHEFLDNAAQYAAHTHILVDNNFNGTNIKGIQILEQLHPMGFANLYLLSGDNFRPGQLPSYITVIPKTDIEPIARILKSISVAS